MGNIKINRYDLIVDGVMADTDEIRSSVQNVAYFSNIGIHFIWTGDAVGTYSIWASNTDDEDEFFQITDLDAPFVEPSGTPGVFGTNLNQFPWEFVQVRYVNDSGTGVLNVKIFERNLA